MIIGNKTFIPKTVKTIIIVVDIILIIASISIVILIAIGQFFEQGFLYVVGAILGTIGLLSLGDLFVIWRLGQPIVEFLYLKLFYRYDKDANHAQKQVLDKIFANRDGSAVHASVFIYGNPCSGKSESVNIIFDYILRNLMQQKKQEVTGYEYIDCYNDAYTVNAYINTLSLHKVNNKILIFDNINEADGSVIDSLMQISIKKNCCVLFIEENGEEVIHKLRQNESTNAPIKFEHLYLQTENNDSIKAFLVCQDKEFILNTLIAIIVLTRYHHIFKIQDVIKLTEYKKLQILKLKRLLNFLNKKNLIESFPINSSHYRLNSIFSSDEYLFGLFPSETLRDKYLIKYRKTFNTSIGGEILWLNLLDLPELERSRYGFSDHIKLFSSALFHANFQKLFNALQAFKLRNKNNNEFLYEEACLRYYLNDFTGTISCLENLLQLDNANKLIYEYKLIEALHGSCEEKIMSKVDLFIKDMLSNKENIFNLYGQYWQNHIDSERGNFDIDSLDNTRTSLINLYENGYRDCLILSVIERCFTDQLRMYWMSGTLRRSDNVRLKKEFESIFLDQNNFEYYSHLYFQAGYEHYHGVSCSFIIKGNNEVEEAAQRAKAAYEAALKNSYQKLKSKAATKVKYVDLKATFIEAEFEDLTQVVKEFRLDAEKNKIDVFVAFSDCLISKLRILDFCANEYINKHNQSIINNIVADLNNSERIYRQFNNQYGVTRAQILKNLFTLQLSFSAGKAAVKAAQLSLKSLCVNPKYKIESAIIDSMNRTNLKYKNVYDCIKFYPIILQ